MHDPFQVGRRLQGEVRMYEKKERIGDERMKEVLKKLKSVKPIMTVLSLTPLVLGQPLKRIRMYA